MKSVEAGINGKFLKCGKYNGFSLSFYKLVQQLCRLDHNGAAPPGSNVYNIHVDFYSYILLYVCIMQQEATTCLEIELDQLGEVLSLLGVSGYC